MHHFTPLSGIKKPLEVLFVPLNDSGTDGPGLALACPTLRALLFAALTLSAPAFALANVRTDRPRILLSNGSGFGTSLATFKSRCTTDAVYKQRCSGAFTAGGGSYPAINAAADYLVNGNAASCTTAYNAAIALVQAVGTPDPHSFVSNNGRTMANLAVARDWCEPALSSTQISTLENDIIAYADWYSANPPPETYDVFHDDAPNVANAVALAALALKGGPNDAKATTYLQWADTRWKTIQLPAMAYVGDWWHEGMVYTQVSVGGATWYAMAWSTATDENIFDYAQANANDLFNGYIDFFAYAMRPNHTYFYFGDTTDNKQTVELFSRQWVDMWTLGTGSTLGQGLSDEIETASRPGYDYAGADGYLLALFYDDTKDGTAQARSRLPLARWMSQGANDVVVMHSGWGTDDTAVMITGGDYLGPHQHDETGSFQIFWRGALTGNAGYYDTFDSPHWDNFYSQHSVHANTIAVYEPGEQFPDTYYFLDAGQNNVNEGGQRPLRRDIHQDGYPSTSLSQYLTDKTSGTMYETGNITAFEQDACHQYAACDVTAAYVSPGFATNGNAPKVDEVVRQFVFLPPNHFVVFDRVESLDAGFQKRFILNVTGTVTVNADNTFALSNDGGTLLGVTVLPADAGVNVVTHFEAGGQSWPPAPPFGIEQGGTRLEIVPSVAQTRDYFLHLFDTTDTGVYPAPALQETAATATVVFADSAATYTLSFNKTGPVGGHLQVVLDGGAQGCNVDLGSASDGGTSGTDSGTPATDGGTTQDAGAGLPDGGVGPAKSGCGCGASGASVWGGVGLAAAAGLLRRRRRSGSTTPRRLSWRLSES
jgi:hypothetical protein